MPRLTPLGELVKAYLLEIEARHPEILQVKAYVLMPDHLHICVWMDKPSRQTPLQYLTTFLLFAQKEAKARFGIETLWQLPGLLWIAYSTERFNEKKAYTCGNIARWHMDHETRELSHPHALVHPCLDPQYPWEGYGNLDLLEESYYLPCYISSRSTPSQIETFTRLAIALAKEDWILVGGFVSPTERQLLTHVRMAVSSPRIIQVTASQLHDEKVSARLAPELYKGRFLRITSATGIDACQRPMCVWHNLWIDAFCDRWRMRVKEHFQKKHAPVQKIDNLVAFLDAWQSPRSSAYRGARALPLRRMP